MKTLYLECAMGAAGDMLCAALLELLPDPKAFLERVNALGLPEVTVSAAPAEKCGIKGTHFAVRVGGVEEESQDVHHGHTHDHDHGHAHDHEHHHHDHEGHGHGHDHAHDGHHEHHHTHCSLGDIESLLQSLSLPEKVHQDALAVYRLIADAESQAHGVPVEQIHFHEVGNLDAVADVVTACLLMAEIAPQQVLASPVHVGSGQVRCAHGILPVPAPATATLLQGIPMYGGGIQGELCTPTGAALLRHFCSAFGPMPPLAVSAIGYGMGKKDFPQANALRAFLGETQDRAEEIIELSCNLDDMTPEALGYAQEQLLAASALDVYTQAIGMKKNRPGILLTCLCRPEQVEAMTGLLLRHTTTLGVRQAAFARHCLERTMETIKTPHGPVRFKVASGHGISRAKPEYDDLAAIARRENLSLTQVEKTAWAAFEKK